MVESKVVIVTGGNKGIGAEIGHYLLQQNWRVVIADNQIDHKQFKPNNTLRLLLVKTDVGSESSVKKMIHKTINQFGRLDALINNAGILPNEEMKLEKTSLKTWDEYLRTNLTGSFLCSKFAVPHLRKQKGSIVIMASTRALQSEGFDFPYSATKGGLVALTHALAVNLGPEIRVNCISPGWINSHNEKLRKIDHSQHLVGRVGIPEDIAAMAEYLISEKAAFITGQNFVVDGGMTIKMIYQK